MSTLSAKCTKNTKSLIQIILNTHPFFRELKESGISTNPSWFCKFSIEIMLKNINSINQYKITDFAQSHYVDIFDETLIKFINKECNKTL